MNSYMVFLKSGGFMIVKADSYMRQTGFIQFLLNGKSVSEFDSDSVLAISTGAAAL